MRIIYPLSFLLLCLVLQAQKINNKPYLQSEQNLSKELTIKAGYAFRFNDYPEALRLYEEALVLDPDNQLIQEFIEMVKREMDENEVFIQQKILAKEREALAALENEALRIKEINNFIKDRKDNFSNTLLMINLQNASEKNPEAILSAINAYYEAFDKSASFGPKQEILDHLLLLGNQYCSLNQIYPWKYLMMGKHTLHMGERLEYYITAINYNHDFSPAFEKIKLISLPESFSKLESQIKQVHSIPAQDNPVMNDYKIYSSAHPSIMKDLILSEEKQLNVLNRKPFIAAGSMALIGGIGIAIMTSPDTNIIFKEGKQENGRLNENGKAFDLVSWSLVGAALPVAGLTYYFSKDKRRNLKNRITYLQQFLE